MIPYIGLRGQGEYETLSHCSQDHKLNLYCKIEFLSKSLSFTTALCAFWLVASQVNYSTGHPLLLCTTGPLHVLPISNVLYLFLLYNFSVYICVRFCLEVFLWFGLFLLAVAVAKLLQSFPTLCNPKDGSPPGSPIPGILQARTLEGVAISFSNAGK